MTKRTESRSGVVIEQRRTPVQERSKDRVNLILSVAAEVISEVGVEGAKTSEIARRAGISLASLYRYFPNKSAIVKAIAEQHIEKLDKQMKSFVQDFDLEHGFDQLIDTYARFYREEPGYKEIWSGVEAMPELQELDLGQLYDNAQDISEKAREVFPRMDQDRLWLICVMLPRICSGTLRLAMNMDEPKAAMMLQELKLMLKAYLREKGARQK